MQSLFILFLYAAVGSCSSSEMGAWPADSWFSDLQGLVLDVPVMVEVRLLQAYTLFRQHPLFAVPVFYLLAGYLLYRLSKLFTKEPSYNFKIIQEASSEGLLAAVKAELESFKQEIRKTMSERPAVKESVTPEAFKQLSKEIQQLTKIQSEFQIEILESHKDLWQTLNSLQIRTERSERSEEPVLSNGSAFKLPKETLTIVPTYEPSEALDDYGVEQSSHNASFGSSINPSIAFSVKEEVEKEDTSIEDVSRKDSVSPKLADNYESIKLDEPQPYESEPIKIEEHAKLIVETNGDETTKTRTTEPLKRDGPFRSRPAPVEPVNVKATFQRRRDQHMPEVAKSDARARFVPPNATKNPFAGL